MFHKKSVVLQRRLWSSSSSSNNKSHRRVPSSSHTKLRQQLLQSNNLSSNSATTTTTNVFAGRRYYHHHRDIGGTAADIRRSHYRRFASTKNTTSSKKETAASTSTTTTTTPLLTKEWATNLSPTARDKLFELLRSTGSSQTTSSSKSKGTTGIVQPSREELNLVITQAMIPFFGFGLMDNAILIIAGDAIDASLGVMLGISTMCAAAIGNIVSDVAGVALGTVIEEYSSKLGLPVPQLSTAQRQLRSVRYANQLGNAIGIVLGCIVGMFPLLFLDPNKAQIAKQEKQMTAMFADVVGEAKELVGAEMTHLFVIVESPTSTTPIDPSRRVQLTTNTSTKTSTNTTAENKKKNEYGELYFYSQHKDEHSMYIPVGRGVVSRTAKTGTLQNIFDVQDDPDVVKDLYAKAFPELELHTMLCVPIMDTQGRVIAVLQAINKVQRGNLPRQSMLNRRDSYVHDAPVFTNTDVSVLKVLASHIAVSLQTMYDLEEDSAVGWSLKHTIDVLKEQGLAGLQQPQQQTS